MNSNPDSRWKLISIVLISAIVTTLIIAIGMASFREDDEETRVAAVPKAAAPVHKEKPQGVQVAREAPPPPPSRPSANDIANCNAEADEARRTAGDTFKDALIGGAAGAGIGAAGGAIAKGGKGAGKGAGIGGIVGAAAGTLYGLNESNKSDERVAAVYRDCMARRGF